MAVFFERTGTALAAAVGLCAVAGLGGFAAGFHARPVLGEFVPVDVSAADNVSLRFPVDWSDAPASPPGGLAFASADASLPLFDPTPIYPAGAERALAAERPLEAEVTGAVPEASEPKMQLASLAKTTTPAPRSLHRSNAVLNESQIASIKRRLNLTREQEQYWPTVAAELRKMEYKRDKSGAQTAAVDMSKVNVEGLKSAGFPLVMSFNDDQRRELNSLAHLLGLEKVLSGI